MWENAAEPGRPRMALQGMRTATWITKATDTLTIRNTYHFSTATMVTRKRLNVTLNVHCLSCSTLMLTTL
jgi:hypothetical protein